ncbi:MAG: UDP-N-acetylmuramoyl-L-alanyl-D-glutamate--2,6-diaminopimelate ligase [Clostridia bacterium]|nr:UDP-N-acetylmuramoyl-L-alanyl-D-glutamate--2,6-diaminopimelate ligase [Clostridia bacterium]
MKLKELAKALLGAKTVCGNGTMQQAENTEISGLCCHSKDCKKGDLFFCIVGGKADGHRFVEDAIEKGASAVVCQRELDLSVPQIVADDTRTAMGLIASVFYGEPSKRLKIIGVTGTNGKTTVSYMLAEILKKAGKKVGVIGTLGIVYGKKKIAPELTTPDPLFLHGVFADMVQCGVEYAVMEVSAHALYYEKDAGISYSACIFTNFSQDHLDFFSTMEAYQSAKKKLFFNRNAPIVLLNGDDATGREIGRALKKRTDKPKTLYYALDTPSEVFCVVTDEDLSGSECMFNLCDELCRVSLSLSGKHNVYNAMAAASCAYVLGISATAIASGLKALKKVDGRLERLTPFHGAEIFLDFAHTPDGLEQSLKSLKRHCKGKLYCLFGCGGDRDKTKRPLMGEVAAKNADFSILTSDNPRFEEPTDILDDIETGYRRFSTEYIVIPERKDAVEYALTLLGKGDVLLLAGKGGEDTQEYMGIKYAYNDKTTVEEGIQRLCRRQEK